MSNIGLGNNGIYHKSTKSIVGVVILVIVLSYTIFIIHGSNAKPSYSFEDNTLTISGQFGTKIDLSGARIAHEFSQVPATGLRTNGTAIGKIEKGYFKMSRSEVYLNVMDENVSDYILITDGNGSKYYVNCSSTEETDSLYSEISNYTRSAK